VLVTSRAKAVLLLLLLLYHHHQQQQQQRHSQHCYKSVGSLQHSKPEAKLAIPANPFNWQSSCL
jgi:hypothetical protein